MCKTVEFSFRLLTIPPLFSLVYLRFPFPFEFNFKWCGSFPASFKFVTFVLLFNSLHMHISKVAVMQNSSRFFSLDIGAWLDASRCAESEYV